MSAHRSGLKHAQKARKFLNAAEVALGLENWDPAASDAITAGINAKDAMCFALTGTSATSQDHVRAVSELAAAGPEGRRLAPTLKRLISLKSKAQYGADELSATSAHNAVKWAVRMVETAERAVNGT